MEAKVSSAVAVQYSAIYCQYIILCQVRGELADLLESLAGVVLGTTAVTVLGDQAGEAGADEFGEFSGEQEAPGSPWEEASAPAPGASREGTRTPEFKSQLPYEGGAFYTIDTIELAWPHYQASWVSWT